MIKFLVKLGNKLDRLGHIKSADLVDSILSKLAAKMPHDEDWDDMDEIEPTEEELAQIESEDTEELAVEGESSVLDELLVQINVIEDMLKLDDVPERIKTEILPAVLERLKEAVSMLTKEQPAWGASREGEIRGLPLDSDLLPLAEASKLKE